MNQQVIEALKRSRYKVLKDHQELEDLYRLRYSCYLAEEAILRNERGMMHDAFDETGNCVHVAIEMEGRMLAAVRLHLVSELSRSSPTLEVFPEVLEMFEGSPTILDPTRFVIDPSVRKRHVPLHFLALRIPFMATMHYDIDVALAPVRGEHIAFYRRYLGYEPALQPRIYPGLRKPIHLLTADVRQQRNAVLARTPVFGPVDEVPHSGIAFPDLAEWYVASKPGRPDAA